MTLIYADGTKKAAMLLARTENKLRVAVQGEDDSLEIANVHGTWVTEDCEVVRVQYAWEGKTSGQILTEAECVCANDLAARLIYLLQNPSAEPPQSVEVPHETTNGLGRLTACSSLDMLFGEE